MNGTEQYTIGTQSPFASNIKIGARRRRSLLDADDEAPALEAAAGNADAGMPRMHRHSL